jgi:hypothetical protein
LLQKNYTKSCADNAEIKIHGIIKKYCALIFEEKKRKNTKFAKKSKKLKKSFFNGWRFFSFQKRKFPFC